jgi:hypothetical protein
MRFAIISIIVCLLSACGQEEIAFPSQRAGISGECGAYYPGSRETDTEESADTDEESPYGMAQGKLFPCAVWESARLAGQDTYINIGEQYLATKHGVSDRRSVVVVVSAEGCSQCALLIRHMAERADEFDEAGALMIGMARSVLGGAGPDFTLDEAAATLAAERWPMARWHIINDEEYYFDASFESNNPWLVVVSLADMRIVSLGNDTFPANASGVSKLLTLLTSL